MPKYRLKYVADGSNPLSATDESHLVVKEFEAANEEAAKKVVADLWSKMTEIKKLTGNDSKLPRDPRLEEYRPIKMRLPPYHFSPHLEMKDPDVRVY